MITKSNNTKAVVRENRASAEYAKIVFDGLYSDKDIRVACARLLADSIFTAHHISSSCWSLTVFPKKIRLNVGPVEVLVLSSDDVFLVIADSDNKLFDKSEYCNFVMESLVSPKLAVEPKKIVANIWYSGMAKEEGRCKPSEYHLCKVTSVR